MQAAAAAFQVIFSTFKSVAVVRYFAPFLYVLLLSLFTQQADSKIFFYFHVYGYLCFIYVSVVSGHVNASVWSSKCVAKNDILQFCLWAFSFNRPFRLVCLIAGLFYSDLDGRCWFLKLVALLSSYIVSEQSMNICGVRRHIHSLNNRSSWRITELISVPYSHPIQVHKFK